eukprot:766751-Hanusia_phi.AAC.12
MPVDMTHNDPFYFTTYPPLSEQCMGCIRQMGDSHNETLVVYTYENLKTYAEHVAERKTYVSKAVKKAQQVLLYGASFFGFSNANELDVWCTNQFRRVDTILRPIVDRSYNMRNSVVLKKMSVYFCSMFPLFGTFSNKRAVQNKAHQDDASSSKARVKLGSSLQTGEESTTQTGRNSSDSKRRPREYDDSTWLALVQDAESPHNDGDVQEADSDVCSDVSSSAHVVPPNIFSSTANSAKMLIPEYHNRELQVDGKPILRGRTYAF